MKQSWSQRKKQSIANKIKPEDCLQVSEEEDQKENSQDKQLLDEDQQLGWSYFQQSKQKIQKIVLQLLPRYHQYRKILHDSLRQICQEANISYDHGKLTSDPLEPNQLQKLRKPSIISLDEKLNTVEKIISQRKIKIFYRNKHQLNFQDELDPQDDERQIYRFYNQAFASENKSQKPLLAIPQQLLVSPSSLREPDNKILDLSNQYQIEMDESFQRTKKQNPKIGRINFTKIQDPFIGFQHQLSFDVKNEPYFVNDDRPPFDSFGFPEDDKHEVNSQINFDSQKLRKFNRGSKNTSKQIDKLSHADNLYRNYIEQQNQQLNKQKQRVQELTQKAQRVINNETDFQDSHVEETPIEEDQMAQLRYLFGEAIQIFSVEQCLKYSLKFRSFELLSKLYENASDYYGQEISLEEPILLKHFSQIVRAALPEQNEDSIKIVIKNIYGTTLQISYQEFLDRLTSSINDREYEILDYQGGSSPSKTFQLTVRLFSIWIEADYFEKQLRQLLENNQQLVDRFIEQTTQNALVVPNLVTQFISRSKKFPKSKKLKSEVFFRKMLGQKLFVSQFYRWIDSKTNNSNQSLQKQQQEEKYEYYYHLS